MATCHDNIDEESECSEWHKTFEKNQEQTNLYNKLSTREIEVLNLICSGKKNNEMAIELNINPKTVSTYKTRLMKKLQVNNIIALIDLGRQKK